MGPFRAHATTSSMESFKDHRNNDCLDAMPVKNITMACGRFPTNSAEQPASGADKEQIKHDVDECVHADYPWLPNRWRAPSSFPVSRTLVLCPADIAPSRSSFMHLFRYLLTCRG
jgi:hypothetical protein